MKDSGGSDLKDLPDYIEEKPKFDMKAQLKII